MLFDLRLALRQALHQPGFAAIAVLTLALAIAANTSIFSLLNGGLLRPAVGLRPDEYVCVYTARRDAVRDFRPFSHAEFLALREKNPVFTDAAAVAFGQVALGREGELHRSFAFLVSENFYSLAGVAPAAGRFFTAPECQPGAGERVVVASDQLWRRSGRRADFIGSTLTLNGHAFTVIGIAPAGFSGVSAILAPELWLPLGVAAEVGAGFRDSEKPASLADPRDYRLNLLARLRPGETLDSVGPMLAPLAARLDRLSPDRVTAPRELILAYPFGITPTPQSNNPLKMLGALTLGMAALVLAIACLNLANMLLARGASRSGEFAVRLALGGSRALVVRQLLAESLLIAFLGGVLGCLAGGWGASLLQDMLQSRVASLGFVVSADFRPDLRVLLVTLGSSALVTLLFSLGPALQSTRVDLVTDLKQRGGGGRSGTWDRLFSGPNLLVTAQIAVSVALLFVAGLFLRGALAASRAPVGLSATSTIMGELDFSLTGTPQIEVERRASAIIDRLRTMAGTKAAGLTTLLPFANVEATGHVAQVKSSFAPKDESPIGAVMAGVTPDFLPSLGVHWRDGRGFTLAEAGSAQARVCIIDEGLAVRLFLHARAVGQHVVLSGTAADGDYEVIGVVNAHAQDAADAAKPLRRVYVPLATAYSPHLFFAVNSSGPAGTDDTRVALIRQQLLALDPQLPLVALRQFGAHLADNFTLWQARLGAEIFGAFGGVALLLAAIGIYGVKAHAVARRTKEIGIRMALGANRTRVVRLILQQTIVQLGVALGVGAILSLICGRLLAGFLVNVPPADPVAFAFAGLCLAIASLIAAFGPACRATKVDPMVALRAE